MTDLHSDPPTEWASHSSSFPVGSAYSWNGPVCNICGQGYIGHHTCNITVLQQKIDELQRMIDKIKAPAQPKVSGWDFSEACPCNLARGGSGICNCTLGGPKITC